MSLQAHTHRGRWSVSVQVLYTAEEANIVVVLTRRLNSEERGALSKHELNLRWHTLTSLVPHIRSARLNAENPNKGKFFGKAVVTFGFQSLQDLAKLSDNLETQIRRYDSVFKTAVADYLRQFSGKEKSAIHNEK